MPPTLPLVSVVYAAILALLGGALTVAVIVQRTRHAVATGDGGVAGLAQAIRAQANFAEQAPMAIIAIACAELAGASPLLVNALGVVLVVARLASAYALSRSLTVVTPLRQAGAALTGLVVAVAAIRVLLAAAGVAL
jgi:uncharacterized membrane protein YecN with MAPEG domain